MASRDLTPHEVALARRVLAKHELSPPIDIRGLIKEYAQLVEMNIPFKVDAVCLNLKSRDSRPIVILNTGRGNEVRQRFTLAHELGHVLIPWHTGSIADDLDDSVGAFINGFREAEANRFASELLMPTAWVQSLVSTEISPFDLVEIISQSAVVSVSAARIKLLSNLPEGYVYCESDHGVITRIDVSPGTKAYVQSVGELVDPKSAFSRKYANWERYKGCRGFFWWHLTSDNVDFSGLPSVGSRDFLLSILTDAIIDGQDIKKILMTINGIIGALNGRVKSPRTRDALYYRLHDRFFEKAKEDILFKEIVGDAKFDIFLKLRVLELL